MILNALQFPDLNPAALTIPAFDLGSMHLGPFPLRWYALAYIVGLLLGWRWMVYLIRQERLWAPKKPTLTVPQADDFLFWATLGVILGGRLGYVLFYMLPDPDSRARVAQDFFTVIRIWDGGMSFHGGLIGVTLAAYLFTREHKLPLLGLGDLAAAATPIGLFFGRLANFINGELWGRPSHVPWAIVFPEGGYDWRTHQWIHSLADQPRHPSQLYEATLEGIVLFTIVNVATLRFGSLKREGLNTGIFLLCYGLFRASLEFVREPDRQMPDFLRGYLTMGMLLSTPMIILGAWLIHRALAQPEPKTA